MAPHFQAPTRRMGHANERREPCMLMATVRARRAWSLMLIKKEDRPSDGVAGDACWEWHRHSACGNSAKRACSDGGVTWSQACSE